MKVQIQEAILPEFGSERFDWLPTMICLTCYKDLAVWKQNPRYVLHLMILKEKQAGAELCQDQLSLKLASHKVGSS